MNSIGVKDDCRPLLRRARPERESFRSLGCIPTSYGNDAGSPASRVAAFRPNALHGKHCPSGFQRQPRHLPLADSLDDCYAIGRYFTLNRYSSAMTDDLRKLDQAVSEITLDPVDWEAFRSIAHRALDDAID